MSKNRIVEAAARAAAGACAVASLLCLSNQALAQRLKATSNYQQDTWDTAKSVDQKIQDFLNKHPGCLDRAAMQEAQFLQGDATTNSLKLYAAYGNSNPKNPGDRMWSDLLDKDAKLLAEKQPCAAPTTEHVVFGGGYAVPPVSGGGYFVQVGVGYGSTMPSTETSNGISSSSVGINGGVGYRLPFDSGHSWGSVSLGLESHTHDESFPPPLNDAYVHTNLIFTQTLQLGPNFPLSNGLMLAPYAQIGVAESNIKVSDFAGSDSKWSYGPVFGGGFDVRVSPSLLLDFNVHTSLLNMKSYQTGPFSLPIRDQATSATAGFIYQFHQGPPPPR